MDTHECQPLYLEIQEFYEGLNMKIEQQVPLLLVERQALNEAMEGEKNVNPFSNHMLDKLVVIISLIILFLFVSHRILLFNIMDRVIITWLRLEASAFQRSRP